MTSLPRSPLSKIHACVAGSVLEVGSQVLLVRETSAPFPSSQRTLIAYLRPPTHTYWHGLALNAADIGQEVAVEEVMLRDVLPEGDLTRDFTPVVFERERMALMLLAFDLCPICGRKMMPGVDSDIFKGRSPFFQEDQMRRAGIVFRGGRIPGEDHKFACRICEEEGRVSFTCAFCDQKRKSDQLHEVYYEEPLCTVCFHTLTAAEWERKKDALSDQHRYDYD